MIVLFNCITSKNLLNISNTKNTMILVFQLCINSIITIIGVIEIMKMFNTVLISLFNYDDYNISTTYKFCLSMLFTNLFVFISLIINFINKYRKDLD